MTRGSRRPALQRYRVIRPGPLCALPLHPLLALSVTAAGALACSADFPNQPDSALTLQPVAWPSELHVSDVDTIEIQVQLRDSPETVTGLRVQWRSSNDDVLRVTQLQPAEGASLEDTLVAQRRAVVTARSGGSDTVHVVVEAGTGFEVAESTFVIRATQKWVAVSAGKSHTCGITVDSLAYCWGEGEAGQLGRGRPLGSTVPVRVVATDNLKFDSVSAGDASSCGITTIGLAYCWGSGSEGRLGNGDPSEIDQLIPVRVAGPAFQEVHVGRVACGVTDDLIALCWGGNGEGQLGFHPMRLPPLPPCMEGIPCSLAPIDADTTTNARPDTYLSVSVGSHHTCGISGGAQSGPTFCWGIGLRGALGNATQTISQIPLQVTSSEAFTAVSAGGEHTCALASSIHTYCWGANTDGQLGTGTTEDSPTPELVAGSFASIIAGGHHTCAVTTAGEASCWGLGSSGQLGNGSADSKSQPFRVSGTPTFASLSAGDLHTCGVATDGSLYCWGEGTGGRLGTGSVTSQMVPTRVSEPE